MRKIFVFILTFLITLAVNITVQIIVFINFFDISDITYSENSYEYTNYIAPSLPFLNEYSDIYNERHNDILKTFLSVNIIILTLGILLGLAVFKKFSKNVGYAIISSCIIIFAFSIYLYYFKISSVSLL